jgi:hypothetical protein
VHPFTAHVVPARVQIKTEELGEAGAEMGVYMDKSSFYRLLAF